MNTINREQAEFIASKTPEELETYLQIQEAQDAFISLISDNVGLINRVKDWEFNDKLSDPVAIFTQVFQEISNS